MFKQDTILVWKNMYVIIMLTSIIFQVLLFDLSWQPLRKDSVRHWAWLTLILSSDYYHVVPSSWKNENFNNWKLKLKIHVYCYYFFQAEGFI